MSVAGPSSFSRLPPAGRPINATLDDSSPEISYSGWTTTSAGSPGANVEVIKQGRFYRDTVTYTTTRGASANFSFQGVALYVFGLTGPAIGKFSISIDDQPPQRQNGGSRAVVYDSLLYVGSGFGEGLHTVVITNEEEMKMLALDYFIATSLAAPPETAGPGGPPNPASGSPNSPVGGPFADGGSGNGGAGGGGGEGNGSAGAVIGGILGALAALALLFLAYRYFKWKKAGGEGSFFEACCGPRRKPPQAAGPGKNDFRV